MTDYSSSGARVTNACFFLGGSDHWAGDEATLGQEAIMTESNWPGTLPQGTKVACAHQFNSCWTGDFPGLQEPRYMRSLVHQTQSLVSSASFSQQEAYGKPIRKILKQQPIHSN